MNYQSLISQMTLKEKAGLLSGRDIWSTKPIERLDIPSMYLSDGPHGVRKQLGESDHLGLNASMPATCFPTAATIANSWDDALCETVGEALGQEAASQGVNVLLGPALNIKRSPLCGRNFEYFSEDPYLSGRLAVGYIKGIQSRGLAACPKHFAVNNQELRRMANDSVLDERTLREIYLTGFEMAVKEGEAKSIMSSYNLLGGTYTNENHHLLRDILVDEWGFSGAVVTDWGGSNDHTEGVRAGSHLEMPGTGGDSDRQLVAAVERGELSEALLDERVDELLGLIFSTRAATEREKGREFDHAAHHTLAQRAAEESAVLLKNEGALLPLLPGARVALIGDFAKTPRYQGAGSSVVNPLQLTNVLAEAGSYDLELVGFAQGFSRDGAENDTLKSEAVRLAEQADILLVFIGLPEIYESEGQDRAHMRLPQNQIELLSALSAVNSNLVAVLSGGSAVEMPWLQDCKALVYAGLGGQAGAGAVLRVLSGQVNPSGHLSETYPLLYSDTPSAPYWPGEERTSEYREGLYVGYRYFETVQKPVRFPFGFGLSYTTFAYSDLQVQRNVVSFTLSNTGAFDGAEVAQLYVGCPEGRVFRPIKELRGFQKVFLKAGESKTIEIALDENAFRYFSAETGRWECEEADYSIMIGASAADVRLQASLHVAGTTASTAHSPNTLPSYYSGNVSAVPDEEFARLIGRPIPDGKWDQTAPLELNDTICQMFYAKGALARLAYRLLTYLKNRSEARGKPDLNILFIYNETFRAIAKMTNGAVTMDMVRALLVIVNGHFFKGFSQLIKAFFAGNKARREQ